MQGAQGILAGTDADDVDVVMTEQFTDVRFVTGVLADLDLGSGVLRYVNAGHPPPVVLRKGGAGLGDPAMLEALRIGFVAMALLCILFIWLRTEHHVLRSRLARIEEEASSRGAVEA